MATEFKVEYKRKAEYWINPALITVRPELNGRTELPPIEELVESMVAIGQRVPVEIRKEGDRPVLVSGYSRWRAAVEINKKKLVDGKFLLRCVYTRGNDQEGFIANIHENLIRNDPTEIDDAHNILRLERWGRTHEEIAQIYQKRTPKGDPDTRWVRSRLNLISLGEEARTAVKQGRLKGKAAQAIAKLAEEQQREAVKGEGKIAAPPRPAKKKPEPEVKVESGPATPVMETLRGVVQEGRIPASWGISFTDHGIAISICLKVLLLLDAAGFDGIEKANDQLRYRRGLKALAACTLLGRDYGDWVQATCDALLEGLEAQCWECGTPVHEGECVKEAVAE